MSGERAQGGETTEGRIIGWNDTVRFRLPPGWAADVEEHEGQPVATFRPPPPAGGTLRLVTDRVTPKPDAGGVAATLQEMALRFVRPQDSRASDRSVETREDGATIAQAMMMTDEDGRAETHYLWLVGTARDGRAAVAMFSFALPAILDGDESCAAMLGRIDEAIRTADIL
ncbi:hypothetical protein [Azospirillum agricola]|uniref:hypothetical protein n=1 Tax=Azospirillum agricola TaxID=1720247 RepID=UPI000A0F2675|nr:hypothetical protein [Azospirillum agricola]SMH55820.1 hypothetical protein SAMN02982994_3932 [Azospirillum lipoferum]